MACFTEQCKDRKEDPDQLFLSVGVDYRCNGVPHIDQKPSTSFIKLLKVANILQILKSIISINILFDASRMHTLRGRDSQPKHGDNPLSGGGTRSILLMTVLARLGQCAKRDTSLFLIGHSCRDIRRTFAAFHFLLVKTILEAYGYAP